MNRLLLALLVLAFAFPIHAQAVSKADEVAALLVAADQALDRNQQIAAIRDRWIRDWKANDMRDLSELYEQDAALFPPVGSPINGRDAIANYFEKLINNSHALIVVGSGEVSGNLAYDSGLIQYMLEGYGTTKGFYVMVLKQDSGGEWHIVRHTLNEISIPRPK